MSLTSYRAAPSRVGFSFGMFGWIGRPGGDLLSRVLRHSTMGAGAFHVRVRDGIGCRFPAIATRSSNPPTHNLCVGCVFGSGAGFILPDCVVLVLCMCVWIGVALCVFAVWMTAVHGV